MSLACVTDWRCSTWSRRKGLDPIGSIGSYAGYLLVEVPLPWPRDISEIEELKPLADAAKERNIRIQALVPTAPGGLRHIIYYPRPVDAPSGARMAHREVVVAPSDVIAAGRDLIANPTPATDMPTGPRDVLICGHGTRDRCCGKLGAGLAVEVSEMSDRPDSVRFWRTSHTGGHRYAPCVLVLPEATAWAYVDREAFKRIVYRNGAVGAVLPNYRGTSWLDGSAAQTLERAVLEEIGWSLLSMPRWAETDMAAAGSMRSQMTVRMLDGGLRKWSGVVGKRLVELPNCGEASMGNWPRYDEFSLASIEAVG